MAQQMLKTVNTMKKLKKTLWVLALLMTVVLLFGCAKEASAPVEVEVKRTPITVVNNSQAEYDILSLIIRSYFAAAMKYDYEDYSTSVSKNYIVSDSKPIPVVLNWSYGEGDNVQSARVYLSQSASFENAEIFDVAETSVELENVYTGTTYYWYVEAANESGTDKSEVFSFNVASGVRLVTVDGVENCRDMGGWQTLDGQTVKQGLAYRTARLSGVNDKRILITEKGVNTALNQLKIKTELDLRAQSEMRDGVVPQYGELGETVNFVNIPAPSYAGFLTSGTAKKELLLFADIENYPILFHCAAGVDRTGTLSFMIKALLGVSEENLVMDHELSYGRYRNDETYSYDKMIYAFKKIKGNTFSEKAYNCMKKNLTLSEMAISNIYNIFLNDGAVFENSSLETKKLADGKAEFKLIMRSSNAITSVTVEGETAEYTLENGTLTVTPPEGAEKGKHIGEIKFDDGTKLSFEYK